ncbi:MAG: amidohydrolase family protein [Proteobacteria bacterium]|nr:amidohydrolase family protein [Pseudomonadota bacterium]
MSARRMLGLVLVLVAATPAAAAAPTAVLLRNGVIHTEAAHGTVAGGSVLIVDGRVTAVGRDLVAPPGAEVIDLKGRPVTPALFGGIGQAGVAEIELEATTRDGTLKLGQMRPEFDPSLAFNPDSVAVAVARVEGIGFALLAPGAEPGSKGAPGSSVIAGLASIVRFDGRRPRPPVALEVLVGEEGGALAGESRAAAYMLLAQALEEARSPAPPGPAEQRLLTPAGRRALKALAAEQRPVLFRADRAADIRTAVEFAAREKLAAVIAGGAEAWRVAPLLARAQVPVVIDPLDDLPTGFDQVGATLENAARLDAAGVAVAFSLRGGAPHEMRKLRQAAGNAVAHGMAPAAALAALTRVPARIFRAAGEFGSIEPGRAANLVVWSGDPLEVTSLVDAEWLDGQRQSLRTRQTELRDRYLERIRAGTAR